MNEVFAISLANIKYEKIQRHVWAAVKKGFHCKEQEVPLKDKEDKIGVTKMINVWEDEEKN